MIKTTGAVVMGRHAYDMAEGDFTGYEFQVPIFVLTHDVPEKVAKGENERLTFTFVTDGIASAGEIIMTKNKIAIAGAGSYASVNGLNMYYEIHGSGEPLVMLHGGMSTIGAFYGILPTLTKSRQIIAVEQQGHGHTADIDRPFSFEQMADDTATLLQQLGIKKADVFGYSDGGSVALEMAIRHPELVRKLVLSSAVYNMDGYYPEIKAGLPQMTADALPPQMRQAYEAVAPQPENWPRLVAKAAEHARNFSGSEPEEIQAIKAPALVMVADGDIVRIEHAEELSRLLRTELVVLPDSDHVSYLLEHPDVLLSKLTAFLDAPMPAAR